MVQAYCSSLLLLPNKEQFLVISLQALSTFPLLHLETVLICTLLFYFNYSTSMEAACNLGYRFPWIHTMKLFHSCE